MRRFRGEGGFSLIETVIVIGVISILASIAVPYAAKFLDQSRDDATRREIESLHKVIFGDQSVPTGGFVGDMGRMPATLAQLNTGNGGGAAASTGLLGVKFGWYGPYINTGTDALGYQKDAWGTAYVFNAVPLAGTGQIRSLGADRMANTTDDITWPPAAVNINGRLLVNIFVWDNTAGAFVPNPQPTGYPGMAAQVRFYYANNGAQAFATVGTPTGPPYSFVNYHGGFHAVTATATLPARPATSGQSIVFLPGNNQQTTLNLYLK